MSGIVKLRHFVQGMTRLADEGADEHRFQTEGAALLRALIAEDDWLPEEFTRPHPQYYQQYLLHCDPLERFCVVSFVWGPGQKTPIHDHCVWGLVGMLRGEEHAVIYHRGAPMQPVGEETLRPGDVATVSPNAEDIHTVANGLADRPSISIHVYGGNIGAVRRHVFDAETGAEKPFISGYSAAVLPNLWDRSKEAQAA